MSVSLEANFCQIFQISSNFITVPRSCYQIGRQFSISDDNRLDKTYSVQKTAEECNWECYHQDDCKYWTWNEVTHQCWLKKSQGVLSIRAGSTSASKVCPGGCTMHMFLRNYLCILVMGRTIFDVRSFEAKNRVLEFDYQRWTHLSLFVVRKNDVRVYSMNNLVSLMKAFIVCSFEAKFSRESSTINRWTRSS